MRGVLLLVTTLVGGVTLAGCFQEPQEAQPCPASDFVTIHYEQRFPTEEVREMFTGAGWSWENETNGRFRVQPPEGQASEVYGVVAVESGTSAQGSVFSFHEVEDVTPGGDAPRRAAQDASGLVNETFPNASIVQWIEGEHAQCPEDPTSFPGRVRIAVRPMS